MLNITGIVEVDKRLKDGGFLLGRPRKFNYVELIQHLADGYSPGGAARALGIHGTTVRTVLHKLRYTHGLQTNCQLVAHYLRNGVID